MTTAVGLLHERCRSLLRFMRRPPVFFGLLTVVVLGPLLLPFGYVLTLDSVWGPNYPLLPSDSTPTLAAVPLSALLAGLTAVLGGSLTQSLFMTSLFWGAGLAMYHCAPWRERLPRYFAGAFYMLNPFVMDRFLAGQWGLLLGYALLPFGLRGAYALLQRPGWLRVWPVTLWWWLMTVASFHFLYLFGLVLLIVGFLAIVTRTHRGAVLRSLAGVVGFYIALNAYWWIPFLLNNATQFVDTTHLQAFGTRAPVAGSPWLSVLWLRGFFAPQGSSLLFTHSAVLVAFVPLLGLVAYGTYRLIKDVRSRLRAFLLLLTAYVAILLAVGVAALGARQVYQFLADVVPGWMAMRESHKFTLLLVPWYAVAGAAGLLAIRPAIPKHWHLPLVLGAFSLVVIQVWPLLGGAPGQLQRVQYPVGWQEVRDRTAEGTGSIMMIPWRQYLSLPFVPAPETVANPGPVVFEPRVLVSRRTDIPGITEPPDRPVDRAADRLDRGQLTRADYRILREENVRWIMVLRTAREVVPIDALDRSAFLREVYADEDIRLYELTRP